MSSAYCLALGLGTQNSKHQWLEVFFPEPILAPADDLIKVIQSVFPESVHSEMCDNISQQQLRELSNEFERIGHTQHAHLAATLAEHERPVVLAMFQEDTPPTTVPGAYLKLHLLSHRLAKPHETKLEGIFSVLPNVAWTNEGAIDLDELPQRQFNARLNGKTLSVNCIDKFPKMTDYVVPSGVRIAHTARVRLGAYIGEGTTIMHEGFVNFNAGTLGKSMIEGRISAGVVVGEDSDLGGGSSTMGTLSGGGNIIISVGNECLIGANAGIGIPLGDRCTVESGLYLTAGTKINVLDVSGTLLKVVKASNLSGSSDLVFRRNSLTGSVECKANRSAVALNEDLHANN